MTERTSWFRRLVRAVMPEDFLAAYERDLTRTFAAQQREARSARGARGVAAIWIETLVDLLRTAPREHFAQARQDVAYTLRVMRRSPGFTLVAGITLAVGIGANTAMFSVVNAVLLKPLPYSDSSTLTLLWNHWSGTARAPLSMPELLDFRDRLQSASVAAYEAGDVSMSSDGSADRLRIARVTPNTLDVLGVTTVLGRGFVADEERPGRGAVALVTDDLWRRRFGGSRDVIGRTIVLDREPHTIVGVLPPGFALPTDFGAVERIAILIPFPIDPAAPRTERGVHFLTGIARVRPGFSLPQAREEVAGLARAWIDEYPGEYDVAYGAALLPVFSEVIGDDRRTLLVLLGAVAIVLFVACANVANLLLARGRSRAAEIAVRKASGASDARLARQVVTESLVLSLAGAAGGVALAAVLLAGIVRGAPEIPRIDLVRLDAWSLIFCCALAVTTALLFGSIPALDLSRRSLSEHLRGEGRTTQRHATQGALVAVQVALALVLLIASALLVQSFARLTRVPSGIDTGNVLTMRVSLPVEGYRERADVVRFFTGLLDGVRGAAGVVSAGGASALPLSGRLGDIDFYLAGESFSGSGSDRPAEWVVVTPGYLEAIGARLVRGRFPTAADSERAPAVVVVNETLARTYFPGVDAIGERIGLSTGGGTWMAIAGIVEDVRYEGLAAAPSSQIYVPQAQFAPFWPDTAVRSLALAVRTTGDPAAATSVIRAHLRRMDPEVPMAQAMSMSDVFDRAIALERLQMELFGAFAAVTAVLALIGTYGVLAYQVSKRTREIGVRVLLGARPADVVRLIAIQGMRPVLAGVVTGLAVAAAAAGALDALLFETEAVDTPTFAAAAAALLLASLMACVIPAWRALRLQPASALRSE